MKTFNVLFLLFCIFAVLFNNGCNGDFIKKCNKHCAPETLITEKQVPVTKCCKANGYKVGSCEIAFRAACN
uniref:Uncharacterized protein n=1 Tax=Panagrolaimus superbus TaxID=310955 RepID=A0A914Y1A6_9BILA